MAAAKAMPLSRPAGASRMSSDFDDAFILGLIMLFFSAVLYMKVIGPQYEKNRLR